MSSKDDPSYLDVLYVTFSFKAILTSSTNIDVSINNDQRSVWITRDQKDPITYNYDEIYSFYNHKDAIDYTPNTQGADSTRVGVPAVRIQTTTTNKIGDSNKVLDLKFKNTKLQSSNYYLKDINK